MSRTYPILLTPQYEEENNENKNTKMIIPINSGILDQSIHDSNGSKDSSDVQIISIDESSPQSSAVSSINNITNDSFFSDKTCQNQTQHQGRINIKNVVTSHHPKQFYNSLRQRSETDKNCEQDSITPTSIITNMMALQPTNDCKKQACIQLNEHEIILNESAVTKEEQSIHSIKSNSIELYSPDTSVSEITAGFIPKYSLNKFQCSKFSERINQSSNSYLDRHIREQQLNTKLKSTISLKNVTSCKNMTSFLSVVTHSTDNSANGDVSSNISQITDYHLNIIGIINHRVEANITNIVSNDSDDIMISTINDNKISLSSTTDELGSHTCGNKSNCKIFTFLENYKNRFLLLVLSILCLSLVFNKLIIFMKNSHIIDSYPSLRSNILSKHHINWDDNETTNGFSNDMTSTIAVDNKNRRNRYTIQDLILDLNKSKDISSTKLTAVIDIDEIIHMLSPQYTLSQSKLYYQNNFEPIVVKTLEISNLRFNIDKCYNIASSGYSGFTNILRMNNFLNTTTLGSILVFDRNIKTKASLKSYVATCLLKSSRINGHTLSATLATLSNRKQIIHKKFF